MLCPNCKKEIKDNSAFCAKCGSKIPRCPTCGKVIQKKTRFCIYDGTPLPDELLALVPEEKTEVESSERDPITVEKRFCSQCGRPTTDGQRICSDCRARAASNPARKVREDAPKKKSVVPLLIVLIALIGMFAIGCCAYFILNDNFPLSFERGTQSESIHTSSEQQDDDDKKNDSDEDQDDMQKNEVESHPAASDEVKGAENSQTAPQELPEVPEQSPVDQQELDPVLNFILNSDRQYFKRSDLDGFDAEMCRIARNGIYARMGRKFQSDDLTAYFTQFSWYTPLIEPELFQEDMLNEYQIANRDLIVAYEAEKGYR